MDEESRRETVLWEHYACFRKGRAGSMICRKTSAEARPLQERLLPRSPKESPSSSGAGVGQKLGVGKGCFYLDSARVSRYIKSPTDG